MANSCYLVMAISTFCVGLLMLLVSIASTSWLGLENGITISLWKVCYHLHASQTWRCSSWHIVPDFVRSAQAFVIISLLCHSLCSIILVASCVLRCLHRSRLALIILSLFTFTSACMVAMAVVVMRVKGKDHLYQLKEDNDVIFQYFLKGVVISGYYEIGWSLILAIVAVITNFISFIFFLLEYKDLTDTTPPVKV